MRIAPIAALVLVAACSSAKAPVEEPEITIVQVSNISPAATGITGGIPVEFQLIVKNVADEPITLKRVDLVSQGFGGYDLPSMSVPFDVVVPPGTKSGVKLVGAANISTASMVGANGPVTLRATVQFDSPKGAFRTIVVQNVHTGTGLGQ
jgi:hypothetical protein